VTRGRRLALGTAILAAPLAWATQLVGSWTLEEGACPSGDVAGGGIETLAGVVTVATLAVALAGAVLATVLRSGRDGACFLARAALLAAALFAVLIVLGGVAVLSLDPCIP
jgi:hypothetical protein